MFKSAARIFNYNATLEHLRPIVTSINTLIGNCENMEATYCVGSDVDVCRMFDQYLYKVRVKILLELTPASQDLTYHREVVGNCSITRKQ